MPELLEPEHTRPVFSVEVSNRIRVFLEEIMQDNEGFGKVHIEIKHGQVCMISMEKTVMMKEQK